MQQHKKPRKGDRDRCNWTLNTHHNLSPFQGLLLFDEPIPGVCTPVCVLSHLRCFSQDSNKGILFQAEDDLAPCSGGFAIRPYGVSGFAIPLSSNVGITNAYSRNLRIANPPEQAAAHRSERCAAAAFVGLLSCPQVRLCLLSWPRRSWPSPLPGVPGCRAGLPSWPPCPGRASSLHSCTTNRSSRGCRS